MSFKQHFVRLEKKKIEPYTGTSDFPIFEGTPLQCCAWPLVQRVRICLDSKILKEGIILAVYPKIGLGYLRFRSVVGFV